MLLLNFGIHRTLFTRQLAIFVLISMISHVIPYASDEDEAVRGAKRPQTKNST